MKTTWQKVYSFFGFWTYREYTNQGVYKVVYWCMFPSFFIRKINIFRWKLAPSFRVYANRRLKEFELKGGSLHN